MKGVLILLTAPTKCACDKKIIQNKQLFMLTRIYDQCNVQSSDSVKKISSVASCFMNSQNVNQSKLRQCNICF